MVSVDLSDPSVEEVVAHSHVKNIGDSAITIQWFRNIESITEPWQSAICDRNACYSVTVDSTPEEQLIVLQPGDSTNIDVHIRPNKENGNAKINVTVVDVDDAKNTVEGTYLFNQTSPVINIQTRQLTLFPNPALDYFELSNYYDIRTLVIFSVAGREMVQYPVSYGQKFDVSSLSRGMYLVRLVDHRNDVLKTLRLNKR